jgi:Na+-transporting NADH:ubiquinone oxidoreductase subunit B
MLPLDRLRWIRNRNTELQLALLIPPVVAVAMAKGQSFLLALLVFAIITLGWHFVFARLRNRTVGLDGLISAVVFALLVQDNALLWQAGLSLTFGIVLGEQVFGGRGFNFLNPVVVALAFLPFSFSGMTLAGSVEWLALATGPAALVMLMLRMISWRMLVGLLFAVAVPRLGTGMPAIASLFTDGTLVIAILFLACDPVSSATNAGRWINGVLIGALILLFSAAAAQQSLLIPTLQAALLASIFAPLIDVIVVAVNKEMRRRRHG